MLRLLLLVGVCQAFSVSVFGQLNKFYTLKEVLSFDTVDFTLKAISGRSHIKNYVQSDDPLVIYGNPDLDKINPSFKRKVVGKTCYATLKLDTYNLLNFGDGFSSIISTGSKEETSNYWSILLNRQKVYRLNVSYGVGSSEIDLSDVKLDDLRLISGSANMKIGYQDDKSNLITMDTFYIKVDFGSINTKNLGHTRAKNVIADIGFGTALLDFGTAPTEKVHCNAKVGAGALDVIIPNRHTPVIVYVKSSPFCGIQMSDDFEEVENNVYVNGSYSAKAENLMIFNIDLVLGGVTFKYPVD